MDAVLARKGAHTYARNEHEVLYMADLLVVKAKIKDVIGDYNVAGDFADELDKLVRDSIAKAVKRADANGRRTVMAKDL